MLCGDLLEHGGILPMNKYSDEELLVLLKKEPYSQMSVAAAVDALNCPINAIKKLRKKHNLKPVSAKCKNGRVMCIRNIGHGGGARRDKIISPTRKARIEQCLSMIENLSAKFANQVFSKDDLRAIAEDAVIGASRTWKKKKGLPWQFYAYRAINRDINRAFATKRRQLERERTIGPIIPSHGEQREWMVDNCVDKHQGEQESLLDKFSDLRGIHRLMAIWLCGLDGFPKRELSYLADYSKISRGEMMRLVEDTKSLMNE